jgi:hypothetical protein
MASSVPDRLVGLALISLTVTAVVTSVHHVYRLGIEVLAPAVVISVLPYLIMRWYRSSESRPALGSYSV